MKRKFIDTAFEFYNPYRKYLLLADEEGQEGAGGGEGAPEGDEGTQEAVHGETDGSEGGSDGGEQQEAAADDWRSAITDEKLREHAKRFTSPDDLVKANLDSRQKLSNAIVRPGKDATPEDVAAYRKAMEIPEEAAGYEFPDLPEGMELTEEVERSRELWAGRFHELNVPASTAKELARLLNEDTAAAMADLVEADKANADKAEEALRKEWKGADYDINMEYKDRAVAEFFGDDLDELRTLELKNGRFALDDPRFLKGLAKIGREMAEGTLGDIMTDTQRDSIAEELKQVRAQMTQAEVDGDRDERQRLYQKEMAIIAKMEGNQPIVGANGRAA